MCFMVLGFLPPCLHYKTCQAGDTFCNNLFEYQNILCFALLLNTKFKCIFLIFCLLCIKQEKEAYRWAIRETVKSMLAFGWTIERTKEGDAFGILACAHRVSQSGQVCVTERNRLAALASQL